MKIRIIICLLFCIEAVLPLYAQEERGFSDVIELIRDSVVVESASVKADARACVNTFSNQTVTSKISVVGCTTLSVQNVVVKNKGDLHFYAPGGVTINNTFTVESGGLFNIGIEEPSQTVFTFDYDASGNRIKVR